MAVHDGRITGGFLGVEMFFVLSGFLITTLLLDEWAASGTLRLRRFYLRRAARLFPALAITIIGVYTLYAVGRPGPGVIPKHATFRLLAVIFYVGNWLAATGHGVAGYLSHTWSLAIEEQFYLVFPVLLLLALRRVQCKCRPARAALCAAPMRRRTVDTIGAPGHDTRSGNTDYRLEGIADSR